MKVSTDTVGDLPIPEELEKEYQAYLEKEGIVKEDAAASRRRLPRVDGLRLSAWPTSFDDFLMDTSQLDYYDGKIVSKEMYDFLIAYELGIIPIEGGYPHSWTMIVPGYEVTCFGWIGGEEIKHPSISMLAKELTKDEYYVDEEGTWRLEEGRGEKNE